MYRSDCSSAVFEKNIYYKMPSLSQETRLFKLGICRQIGDCGECCRSETAGNKQEDLRGFYSSIGALEFKEYGILFKVRQKDSMFLPTKMIDGTHIKLKRFAQVFKKL